MSCKSRHPLCRLCGRTQIAESWDKLLAKKPRTIYYGHAKTAELRCSLFRKPETAESAVYERVKKIMFNDWNSSGSALRNDLEMNKMMQYSMTELSFKGKEPSASYAQADINAIIRHDEKEWDISGFYAGNGIYKVRFLPEFTGKYEYKISGEINADGSFIVGSHDEKHHGIVRAEKMQLRFSDGTLCTPFGTTVYTMMHQNDDLIEETLRSLENSPFDKIRLCFFPKDYDYNKNEPEFFPFERTADGWNVHRPDYRLWDRFEKYLVIYHHNVVFSIMDTILSPSAVL